MGTDSEIAVTIEFTKVMTLVLFVALAEEIRFCLKVSVKFEVDN